MPRARVAVPVSFFFDYNCPFCYIGSVHLLRLGERFPLLIHWRFIEIHPGTPVQGRRLDELGYSPTQLAQVHANLLRLAQENVIPLSPPDFVVNSRKALLLGMAALAQRPERFPALHEAIFTAYFVDGRNIGDPEVLTGLAQRHGVADLLPVAWESPTYLTRLLKHVEAATELQLSGVPALQVGSRVFTGADSLETLAQALERHH